MFQRIQTTLVTGIAAAEMEVPSKQSTNWSITYAFIREKSHSFVHFLVVARISHEVKIWRFTNERILVWSSFKLVEKNKTKKLIDKKKKRIFILEWETSKLLIISIRLSLLKLDLIYLWKLTKSKLFYSIMPVSKVSKKKNEKIDYKLT